MVTIPLVTVQTCGAWTATTPGTIRGRRFSSARSMWAGTDSSRTSVLSRTSRQAPTRIPRESNTDSSGSTGVQPVSSTTTAASTAPAEPSRSPRI